MNKRILFGIVTYKEKYFECSSYSSLVNSYRHCEGQMLNIFVVDNTDLNNWNVKNHFDEGVKITYFHQKENKGISYAYNMIHKFAKINDFDWIVFLDQDTTFPIETYGIYLKKAQESNKNLIAVPKIFSNNKIISPCKFRLYRSILFHDINSNVITLKNISCINSGLIIATNLFSSLGGYNENLRLDFCDHDFIEKVKKKVLFLEILQINFLQDFSANNNTKLQAILRYKIFVVDFKQYSVNRNKFILLIMVDVPHLLKLTYKYKSFDFFRIRFSQLALKFN